MAHTRNNLIGLAAVSVVLLAAIGITVALSVAAADARRDRLAESLAYACGYSEGLRYTLVTLKARLPDGDDPDLCRDVRAIAAQHGFNR